MRPVLTVIEVDPEPRLRDAHPLIGFDEGGGDYLVKVADPQRAPEVAAKTT